MALAGTAFAFDPLTDSLEFPAGYAAARVVLAAVDATTTTVSYTDASVTRTVTLGACSPRSSVPSS
ncbi:hypothetical protein HK414_27960 [Ramlibacter terrae]|uniref:Uncharacterized protein n=1 Tax=Ramlibacter terrae TaxID=2732511 RepID=A0ABX6P7G9_9BURK|nr:hypothetical protein HK414_27960 [Ramlibacter terrae]